MVAIFGENRRSGVIQMTKGEYKKQLYSRIEEKLNEDIKL